MSEVLFSIVTVCYNCEISIEKTMKSILGQDFQNYEYIIVDGASKDKTVDIIARYVPLFGGKMHFISEPDKGIYDAFTKGVKMAKGTYVWIVNCDDYIEPNVLQKLALIIQKIPKDSPLPIISGAMNFVNVEGDILAVCKSEKRNLYRAFRNDDIGVTHPATLVPNVCYQSIGVFDIRFKLSGDVDWFHRVFAAGYPFLFIGEVLTNMSDGGISSQYNWKRYKISLHDRKIYLSKHYAKFYVKLWHFSIWQLRMSKLLIKGFMMDLLKK